ncbi:hypothetical protein FNH09_32755 [Streptomyces adustus]|uniref:Uncharacterized protein n=1 Tax=Streptomyces adustus TaxID=1609272 RepID=A0A5N8VKS1_9ACTN|nr:hypothetical protein [Streptomyces adustus]MPY35831.1 hypothetical protein [Streptomyces adustus]
MSYDGGGNLAPGSGALTYATLTDEARRQAALPRPKARGRREADVRTVPWWRVRTLRGISGLSVLVPAVIYAVVVLAIYALTGVPQALALLVFAAGLALFGAYRLSSGGAVTARALARAAGAPGPVAKRYALVYDPPWGGTALLALFPADGGDQVHPEAVLELRPLPLPQPWFPGMRALPADLPVEPAGRLELRGRTEEAPLGVPWIDGHAYWPKRFFGPGDLRGAEGRALAERLLADAGDGEAVES